MFDVKIKLLAWIKAYSHAAENAHPPVRPRQLPNVSKILWSGWAVTNSKNVSGALGKQQPVTKAWFTSERQVIQIYSIFNSHAVESLHF